MGVTIRLNSPVSAVHEEGVTIGQDFVSSVGIIWAAGNRASGLLDTLETRQDRAGRVMVNRDLTLPGDPWIFVIGDAAHCQGQDGQAVPGLAPVAMQQGRYVAQLIEQGMAPSDRQPFTYADRGMLATIGRAKAVAQIGRIHVSGLVAWVLWCIVHIFFLIGIRSRLRVMSEWIWYYLTFKPGARLLFEQPAPVHRGSPKAQGDR